MSLTEWWLLLIHLSLAGAMATIGSLNIQWWWQDRTERILLYTGALCWSVALVLLLGAAGFAFPEPFLWHFILPVRAVLLGVIVALFLRTVTGLVPLPGARGAIVASVTLPAVFVVFGLTGDRAYVFDGESAWPIFQPLGDILVGLSLLIFVAFSVSAISRMPGVRRWQLIWAVCAAVVLMGLAATTGPSLISEAMTTLWTSPIALMLAWWCSAHVLTLQGTMLSAVARRDLAETEVTYQSRHDRLTGLPNEMATTEALQSMIDRALPTEPVVAFVYQVTGVDETRTVNGTTAAESVIQAVANHLHSLLAAGVEMGQLTETSFLVATPRRRSVPEAQLESEAESTISVMRQSAVLPAGVLIVVGIAVGSSTITAGQLIQHARIAVTAAQQAARPTRVFRAEMREGIVRRARTARLLRAAVERDEFELRYQPVIDVSSGDCVSVEALVRWRHHGRLHPPAEWIPVAEQVGLMPSIGLAVLRIAVRDQAGLGCPVAVNVSPRQLADPQFAATVLATLADCPPAAVILEVTESSVMDDPEQAITGLEVLRAKGIRIALDDFGTRYSSLSRLSTLPIDIIKIDRSFVSRILTADGRALVTAIYAMSEALGKTTVAEGVETGEQFRALQEIGLQLVQGFLTGRPVPLDELTRPNGAPAPSGRNFTGDIPAAVRSATTGAAPGQAGPLPAGQ